MSDQFIPLVPRRAGATAESAMAAKPFQAVNPSAATAHAHPKSAAPPQITFKRDGERITQINVICSCGQVLELACVY